MGPIVNIALQIGGILVPLVAIPVLGIRSRCSRFLLTGLALHLTVFSLSWWLFQHAIRIGSVDYQYIVAGQILLNVIATVYYALVLILLHTTRSKK